LTKKKAAAIDDYNYRCDFSQVLYLKDKDASIIKDCIKQNHDEMKDWATSTQEYYREINLNLENIAYRMKSIQKYGLRIFSKSEGI
jgi:hypothetical protein